ncbi:DNA internalization-related competence protein ComEC/Rec2 [Vibrio xiamenensis]|uniref:DNA internalization-related competence protein ComEC/Rec2 n=1 Tax=Vibrio xiamenensis TaxID=861298 RepID=UPI0015A16CEA|nr:DNA internalization-related competence protein ComEC/Rec2 [Vibrio xiamenensis]
MLRSINGQNVTRFFQPKIRFIAPTALFIGDVIHTQIRLKPILGRFNQVGYDQEAHYFSENILATATMSGTRFRLEQFGSFKQRLITRVQQQTEGLPSQALILALSFGIKNHIDALTWQALKNSGLSHLMAISGLHIGIAFGVGWGLGTLLLRISFAMYRAPYLLGMICALTYAWLAGMTLPTQRALVMCVIYSMLLMTGWRLTASYKWLVTLCVVLLFNPFSTLSSGFWLSFVAVGVIFLFISRQPVQSSFKPWYKLTSLISVQVWIFVGMMPLSLVWFYGVSSVSPLYNLVFVPLFSIVIVPLILIALMTSSAASISTTIWKGVDWLLIWVHEAISAAHFGWFAVASIYIPAVVVLLMVIIIWPLLTPLFRLWCGALLSGYWLFSSVKQDSQWRVDVLDVGHGLAVLIQQGERAYLYDTGTAWLSGGFAQDVITPLMHKRGIKYLDGLVLSHLDFDHAGGREFIEHYWQPPLRLASQTLPGYQTCAQGVKWRWHRLELEAFWPPNRVDRAYNAHSCVLRISDGRFSILLAGDISALGEWLMIRQPNLASDIVIVPHHGSRTSSSQGFVRKVDAKLAIASLEKDGRWGLPDQKVVNRYLENGAIWFDTGSSGQITLDFYSNYWLAKQLRETHGQSWYRQMLRNRVE